MKKPDRREDDGAQGNLFAWAASRLTAEIVSLDQFRARSARWLLVIEPRALGPLDRFDKKYGLAPATPVLAFHETRPLRQA
nr:hypothetical protein [Methylobacterium sp. ZNC0032]